ncbi:cilia- and flagella-associated protein 157-like [Melanotaenia boesemani]|uniref:cilia- and flagella-associated protein 157-like n=1 Tax=Melanotaenia boesemani TaxID=1250792 RepID=UPI001C04180C|nr:cilia- and flagella-associated protein 157-like [Melanotaenia boesemani]
MPKKKEKKSGDKRNENSKTPKKESSPTSANKTNPDDNEKDIYLTQIRHLNEELDRYQLKCDELERQNNDLISQYSTLESEKKDITEYLKRSLLEKEEEVDELSERLDRQQRAADQDRAVLQLQHSRLSKELQDHIDDLVEKNTTLEKRLAGLEEFQKQREALMSKMEFLEKQLAHQEKEHKDEIHCLEMKALLEKRRLEKEIEQQVEAMEAEVQHLVDQKLPETSRLVLQENVEVKACFSQLSQRTQALMEENATLQQLKGQLSVDVDILEQMLRETSRMNCIQKKTVQQLTEKCQQLQTEQKDWRQQLQQLQTEHTGVLTEMETLRQDQASLSEQCSKIREKMSQLKAELQEERRKRSRMKCIMQEAGVTLRQALVEEPTEQDSGVNSVTQWKKLMKKALMVLDRHAVPTSATKDSRPNEPWASDAAAEARDTLDTDLSLGFQVTHRRHSNLSFVPRPFPKHKNTPSRMGAGANSSMVPLYRKPVGPKTLSSVSLTQSAVGFSTSKHSVSRLK